MCPSYFLFSLKLIFRGWWNRNLGSIMCKILFVSCLLVSLLGLRWWDPFLFFNHRRLTVTAGNFHLLPNVIWKDNIVFLPGILLFHTTHISVAPFLIFFVSIPTCLYKWDFPKQSYLNNIPSLLLCFSFSHRSYHDLI